MVRRRLVLTPRLHTMVPMTQGLPVASIPEELVVSTVRNDVVDVRRLNVPAFLHALHTQRVRLKVLFPGFLPCCSVTSARSWPNLFRMHCLVTVAVLLS